HELEPELLDALDEAVQLRLVDDLPGEDGRAGAPFHLQAVEEEREPVVELATEDEPVDRPSRTTRHRRRALRSGRWGSGGTHPAHGGRAGTPHHRGRGAPPPAPPQPPSPVPRPPPARSRRRRRAPGWCSRR